MRLSIIIPLYNEENLIKKVIESILFVKLPEFVSYYEIIIVDDCSHDNSYEVVKEISQANNHIKVFKHAVNKGKGAAVRYGIEQASGEVYLIQDADLELSPKDIPGLLNAMHELNIEFINGSRYLAGIVRPLSSYSRYFINKCFTKLTALIINVNITDMACGYKLIHRNLYNKLNLKENRFGFEAELIIKALRVKKNNIAEVPVNYFPRNEGEGKKLRNIDGLKIFWKIIKFGLFKMN